MDKCAACHTPAAQESRHICLNTHHIQIAVDKPHREMSDSVEKWSYPNMLDEKHFELPLFLQHYNYGTNQ